MDDWKVKGMLTRSRALILADTPARAHSLSRFAHHVGFVEVSPPARSLASLAPEVPVFFFMHDEMDEALQQASIEWVRGHEQPVIRFAPIIVIAGDIQFEAILKYVRMGCDDIISVPDDREELVSRVQSQLKQAHVYIETETYLGPDRRRMELPAAQPGVNRRGLSTLHTRMIIRRAPGHGAFIVSSEQLGSAAETSAAESAPGGPHSNSARPSYEMSGAA